MAEDEFGCDWHKKSKIPAINSYEEFQEVMRTTDTVILEFFAPWCPACVTFKPEFEKLQEKHWDIPMYTVNTDENPTLKKMFNVDTYPRVLLFTKDQKYDPKKYEKKWGLKFEPLNNWLEKELLSS